MLKNLIDKLFKTRSRSQPTPTNPIEDFANQLCEDYPSLVDEEISEHILPLGARQIAGKEGPSGDGDPEYYFEIGKQ